MARYTPSQSVLERPEFHAREIIIYGLVILLLVIGTYWRNRVWKSELEVWTDCVRKSPNKDRPHYNLGNVFLKQGKYEEAINQYKEALRINREHTEAHNNLGSVFLKQGKYQEAINQYKEALRINPDFAEAHYNLGDAYLMIGKRGLGLIEYEILKRISPGLAGALNQKIK